MFLLHNNLFALISHVHSTAYKFLLDPFFLYLDKMDLSDFTSSLILDSSQDNVTDMDFGDLFLGDCWVETTDQFNLLQSPAPSTSAPDFNFLPPFHTTTNNNNLLTFQSNPKSRDQEESETLDLWGNPPQLFSQPDPFLSSQGNNQFNKAWWIPPFPTLDSTAPMSVQTRLTQAIRRLRDSIKDRNLLIQIWVPIRAQGKNVLTTTGQPYTVGPECKSLEDYRNVSENYHFPAEEDSKESVGLPGRVYLKKMPEWTPDVKLFNITEYPRIGYAQRFNVQGSIALPVFERGSGNCLGVVEIVTTTQKINYRSDLEQVRKALEAFDFRSTENCSASSIKACNLLYQPALPEIVEVLTSICRTHRLPLAQTWAPCVEHDKGKTMCSYTDLAHCASILDSAFYAADPQLLEFHEACSDHNLNKGQGVVGKAFTTDKPCFEPDVTTYTKTEYPLSHHAKMFGLRAAVAVRLRSVYTGSSEFVLEFFLPTDCQSNEAQRKLLAALSYSLQQAGQNLRSLTELELKEDVLLPLKEAMSASKVRLRREGTLETKSSPPKESYQGDSSRIASMMGAKEKGKGVSVSLEYKKEPQEEFNGTTHWDNFEKEALHPQLLHDFGTRLQDSAGRGVIENGGESSSLSAQRSSGSRRTGEKRRTKREKSISLQVLSQHFAGSLKDAAKNIGVCPTTLKRICRQHGITRWPSRKIKKVSHSLRKIQLVIDSVQGAEGALQIRNFYSSYPELSSPNVSGSATPFSSVKTPLADQLKQQQPNLQRQDSIALFSLGGTSSKSPPLSCSQSLSLCRSSGTNQQPLMNAHDLLGGEDGLLGGGELKRVHSDAELHVVPKQEEGIVLARAQSHKALGQHPIPSLGGGGAYRVKATYGEEKVRFSLQEKWVFRDVQEEIRKKFNIEDISRMDIKYLDDDSEWVLLTCDADLEECIDICKSCKRHTIKMCVHVKCPSNIGSSYGSIGRNIL